MLSACDNDAPRHPLLLEGSTMGTYYRVTLHDGREIQIEDLKAKIESELNSVNLAMSTYLNDSEISQVNRAPAGQGIELSQGFAFVLNAALTLARDTEGAFDPTVGPLVQLWGFGSQGRQVTAPKATDIAERLTRVGHHHLQLDGSTLVKNHPEVELDLSAIAKGYAIDQVAALLDKLEFDDWLIDIGGELRASGLSGDRHWQVAIENPTSEGGVQQVIALADTAIATSGDYRNFFEFEGRRYSHAVDPSTGFPINDTLASVTVLHESAMMADGFATALLVMGLEKATRFAEAQNLSCYFITRDHDVGLHTHVTGDFVSLIK